MSHIPLWVWLLGLVFLGPKLWYAFQVGRRARGEIRFRTRRWLVGTITYIIAVLVASATGHKPFESSLFAFFVGLAAMFWLVSRKRTRAIPKRIREAVIRRDLKGERFDATIHHIDHIVPFSKGGDNSTTNLRVISKRQNLSRGAAMPTLSDFRKRKS